MIEDSNPELVADGFATTHRPVFVSRRFGSFRVCFFFYGHVLIDNYGVGFPFLRILQPRAARQRIFSGDNLVHEQKRRTSWRSAKRTFSFGVADVFL
jgi:hypothetical protein